MKRPGSSSPHDAAHRLSGLCVGKCLAMLPLAVLTACSSSAGSGTAVSQHSLAVATLQKVNQEAHRCWLGDPAFQAYGIVPELDTTGTPRLLIIPRGKPQSLPKLVIAASGTSVGSYGPLASSDLAPRIKADIGRWAGGKTGCA